jgi:V-type H+-transporting ATPase proteolipid subunit
MGNSSGMEAFPGFAGVSLSIILANLGAGFGMAKSGAGIAGMG